MIKSDGNGGINIPNMKSVAFLITLFTLIGIFISIGAQTALVKAQVNENTNDIVKIEPKVNENREEIVRLQVTLDRVDRNVEKLLEVKYNE